MLKTSSKVELIFKLKLQDGKNDICLDFQWSWNSPEIVRILNKVNLNKTQLCFMKICFNSSSEVVSQSAQPTIMPGGAE